jgi:hypothetical protein
MQDFNVNPRMPYSQSMGGGDDYNNMMAMPGQQLEKMYPKIYFIVNPVIMRHCDMMDDTKGPSYIPTKEELENMMNNIQGEVGKMVKSEMPMAGAKNPDPDPDGSPFLRGLIGTLLVDELLDRRGFRHFRRFPRFFPGFFPGFFPFFPGMHPFFRGF